MDQSCTGQIKTENQEVSSPLYLKLEFTKPGPLVLNITVSCSMHENWQRLLELCPMHNLCITNTLQVATSYYMETSLVPQMAPAWSSYDQTKQRSLYLQQPQRRLRYWSFPDVQTHQTAAKEAQRHSEHHRKFLSEVEKALEDPQGQDATSRWNFMWEAIHSLAMLEFGKIKRPRHDWFNAHEVPYWGPTTSSLKL